METLMKYIPREEPNLLPATVQVQEKMEASEKEAIVRMLLQLKQEVDYLKEMIGGGFDEPQEAPEEQDLDDINEEDLSLRTQGKGLIEKVLRKHGGNRKAAAAELGISERTLYRKLKK